MVWMNECSVCKKKNMDGNVNFTIFVGLKDMITCGPECSKLAEQYTLRNMINNKTFIYYDLIGNRKNIIIKRTSGKKHLSEMNNCRLDTRYISFLDNNLHIIVVFKEGDEEFTKKVSYESLAKYNLHLPVISLSKIITNISDLDHKLRIDFEIAKKKVIDLCIYNNKCLRLLIISFIKNDGYFKVFPEEIFKLIFNNYLNSLNSVSNF